MKETITCMLNNIPYYQIDYSNDTFLAGRGDLRMSITSSCHLNCNYCHNEGDLPPWKIQNKHAPFEHIENLIEKAEDYGVRSIKFTGGDPTMHPEFSLILTKIKVWKLDHGRIKSWGLSTNGITFLKNSLFTKLVESEIDNICFGIDSISDDRHSKPDSPNGVSGLKLFKNVVVPLAKEWSLERNVKINTVYTGDNERTIGVIDHCLNNNIQISVIELNATNDRSESFRERFFELIERLSIKYVMKLRYDSNLNEVYLENDCTHRANKIKFYQDHCRDLDCGHCRKIHMRVNHDGLEWASMPCFLKTPNDTLTFSSGGHINDVLFRKAIRVNGMGPNWKSYVC